MGDRVEAAAKVERDHRQLGRRPEHLPVAALPMIEDGEPRKERAVARLDSDRQSRDHLGRELPAERSSGGDDRPDHVGGARSEAPANRKIRGHIKPDAERRMTELRERSTGRGDGLGSADRAGRPARGVDLGADPGVAIDWTGDEKRGSVADALNQLPAGHRHEGDGRPRRDQLSHSDAPSPGA